MPYLGNAPSATFQSVAYQDLTGGTGTSFTLSHAVSSAQELEVFVNNVRQEPTVAYSAVGTTLTMTGTIAATDDFYVVFQGKAVGSVSHPTTSPLAATTGTFSGAVTATSFSGDGSALTGVSAGKVLQVKKAQKTDKASFSGSSFQAISGLSVSITPSSTLSEILVMVSLACGCNTGDRISFTAFRGATNLSNHSTALSNRTPSFFGVVPASSNDLINAYFSTLDSPSTTSAITYSVSGIVTSSATGYINSSFTDSDSAGVFRGVSSITVMEIEG